MSEGQWSDCESDFLRDAGAIQVSSNGALFLITPSGEKVSKVPFKMRGLEKALEAWNALPETERMPGTVRLPPRESVDPRRTALEVPSGCLILRVYNREFRRTPERKLRYLEAGDFPAKVDVDRLREARHDFMWVLEDEWRGMIPTQPEVGKLVPVPTSLSLRLFRNHLNPLLGLRGAMCFRSAPSSAGTIAAEVVEVTDERVRIRLQGRVNLNQAHKGVHTSYTPALMGELTYDRIKDKVVGLDLIALGDLVGALPGISEPVSEPRPLGIAFEYISDPAPSERLRPHGARRSVEDYMKPKP